MKTMTMGALCALVLMTGCLASEDTSDVTAQESAVELAPLPPPEEDMRKRLNYYCHSTCLIRCDECLSGCTNAACESQCDNALFDCADMCERVFPW